MGKDEEEVQAGALSGMELKAWLKKYKKNRTWLAKKTGWSKSSVNQWCLKEQIPLKPSKSIRDVFRNYEIPSDPFENYDFVSIPIPKEIMPRVKAAAVLNDRSVSKWIMDIIMEKCSIVPDFGDETSGYDEPAEK